MGTSISNPANATPTYLVPNGSTSLNIAGDVVLKATPGAILTVIVAVTGSAAAEVHDCATVIAAAASNLVAVIPNVVGSYPINFPCAVGIVIKQGGAAQRLSASYQ